MKSDDAFRRAYEIGKINRNIDTDKELAPILGMAEKTLWRRNQDIGSYKLSELRDMAKFFRWTADEWLAIGGIK